MLHAVLDRVKCEAEQRAEERARERGKVESLRSVRSPLRSQNIFLNLAGCSFG